MIKSEIKIIYETEEIWKKVNKDNIHDESSYTKKKFNKDNDFKTIGFKTNERTTKT